MKNVIPEIKNLLDKTDSSLNTREEKTRELQNTAIEATQSSEKAN